MTNHYVYTHYDNGEVVYIGAGKNGRCWDTHGSRRNSEHLAWMKTQLPLLDYKIEFISEDRAAVFKFERELISKHDPKYNLAHRKEKPSQEACENRRVQLAIMNKITKTCAHCQNDFTLGMYSRWHGDNCKLNKGLNT